MFDKLKKYMEQRFKLLEINEKPLSIMQGFPIGYHKYALKNISQETKVKFEQMCASNNLKWNIETKTYIGHNKPLEGKEVDAVKTFLLQNTNVKPNVVENYCNILKHLNGIGLQGIGIHGVANTTTESLKAFKDNVDLIRPLCMQNSLVIGSYFGNPACLNADGEIIVYDGTALKEVSKHLKNVIEYSEFQGFNEEQKQQRLAKASTGLKKFLESDVPAVAYWPNAENFVTDEVIRLTELYLDQPYMLAPKSEMLHNITPSVSSKLVSEGKIKTWRSL